MENILHQYFRGREDVAAVFLFGSHAAGKAQPGSDVDIAVLFRLVSEDAVRDALDAFMTELPALLRKDVHPVSMNHAGEILMAQVLKKGRCVVVNDPRRLAEFRISALARIFDFTRYREQMQAGLVRSILKDQ